MFDKPFRTAPEPFEAFAVVEVVLFMLLLMLCALKVLEEAMLPEDEDDDESTVPLLFAPRLDCIPNVCFIAYMWVIFWVSRYCSAKLCPASISRDGREEAAADALFID